MATVTTDRQRGLSGSLGVKAPVLVATTANITLSALQTVDGVSLAAGDRVLVKDQSTASENGIYVVATSSWARSADFNGSNDGIQGTQINVASGTAGAGRTYRISTANPFTIGTDSIAFTLITFDTEVYADAAAASASAAAASAVTAASTASLAGAATSTTSVTSLAIGTGTKNFTTADTGLNLQAGDFVICSSSANVANYMHGQILSYSGTALSVNVTNIGGSGTKNDWLISESGTRGAAGADGAGSGDLVAANNLSDVASANTSRTNLGLAIGTDVQAYDADLSALAGVTSAANTVPFFDGSESADIVTLGASQLVGRGASGNTTNITLGAGLSMSADVLSGSSGIIQEVRASSVASATGTTQFPNDDTIPQNTEGFAVFNLAITPSNASSVLVFDIMVNLSGAYAYAIGLALFQDTAANSIAFAFESGSNIAAYPMQVVLRHYMTAGTTSATTFKVRAGTIGGGATVVTVNGTGGARKFGGALVSNITIREMAS